MHPNQHVISRAQRPCRLSALYSSNTLTAVLRLPRPPKEDGHAKVSWHVRLSMPARGSRARRSEDGRADPGALTLPQVMDNGHLSAVKLIIIGATAAADMSVWSAVDAAAARVRFGPAAHDVRHRAPVRQWPWELLGRLPAAWRPVPRRDEARGLLGRVGMPCVVVPLSGGTCGTGRETV